VSYINNDPDIIKSLKKISWMNLYYHFKICTEDNYMSYNTLYYSYGLVFLSNTACFPMFSACSSILFVIFIQIFISLTLLHVVHSIMGQLWSAKVMLLFKICIIHPCDFLLVSTFGYFLYFTSYFYALLRSWYSFIFIYVWSIHTKKKKRRGERADSLYSIYV
jgi:hypothetical protein